MAGTGLKLRSKSRGGQKSWGAHVGGHQFPFPWQRRVVSVTWHGTHPPKQIGLLWYINFILFNWNISYPLESVCSSRTLRWLHKPDVFCPLPGWDGSPLENSVHERGDRRQKAQWCWCLEGTDFVCLPCSSVSWLMVVLGTKSTNRLILRATLPLCMSFWNLVFYSWLMANVLCQPRENMWC